MLATGRIAAATDCRLLQVTSDNFDWTRIAGRTVSGRLSERRIDSYRYPVTGPEFPNRYRVLNWPRYWIGAESEMLKSRDQTDLEAMISSRS